jgi:ferritin-like metal-binding protein YciE
VPDAGSPAKLVNDGLQTLTDLLKAQIQVLYSAEQQLTRAIPTMAKGSHDAALALAFTNHLKETEGHIERLEQVRRLLDIMPTGRNCGGMEGVIKDVGEALEEEGTETARDLAILGAGSRIERYEIAGYITAAGLAERLGRAKWRRCSRSPSPGNRRASKRSGGSRAV